MTNGTDESAVALVTGVAGFIGSHLARGLLDRGYAVVGVDNFESGSRDRIGPLCDRAAFEFVEGDVRDEALAADLVERADHVFHQAAVASVARSFDELRLTTATNCTGTATVLSAAAEADVESVVVASSAAVYGSEASQPVSEDQPVAPESPYALSKYWTEQAALQLDEYADLGAVALRYFNVFGPGQDASGEYAAVVPAFLERVRNGRPPVIYGDGGQSRDFVYVDDVVEANVAAAERDAAGEVYNVASGERTTINELAAQVCSALDADLDPIHEDPRPGDVRHSWADISKIRSDLGFEPTVDVRSGLERMVGDSPGDP